MVMCQAVLSVAANLELTYVLGVEGGWWSWGMPRRISHPEFVYVTW